MRIHGRVSSWFSAKGFGFIQPDGDATRVFLIKSEILGHGGRIPAIHDRVSFDVTDAGRGPRAVAATFDSDHA